MKDTLITLTHDSLPGSLYFRGYLSKKMFLKQNSNKLDGIFLFIFDDDPIILPLKEVHIDFKRVPY